MKELLKFKFKVVIYPFLGLILLVFSNLVIGSSDFNSDSEEGTTYGYSDYQGPSGYGKGYEYRWGSLYDNDNAVKGSSTSKISSTSSNTSSTNSSTSSNSSSTNSSTNSNSSISTCGNASSCLAIGGATISSSSTTAGRCNTLVASIGVNDKSHEINSRNAVLDANATMDENSNIRKLWRDKNQIGISSICDLERILTVNKHYTLIKYEEIEWDEREEDVGSTLKYQGFFFHDSFDPDFVCSIMGADTFLVDSLKFNKLSFGNSKRMWILDKYWRPKLSPKVDLHKKFISKITCVKFLVKKYSEEVSRMINTKVSRTH